jgi:hypothetical protein
LEQGPTALHNIGAAGVRESRQIGVNTPFRRVARLLQKPVRRSRPGSASFSQEFELDGERDENK